MATFPVISLKEYAFHNLLGLLECAVMLQSLIREIKVLQPNFSNRAIGIANFIAGTMTIHKLVSKFNVGLTYILHQGLIGTS